jgi:hypothetical protein
MEFKITLTEEDIKTYPNNYELGAFIRKKYSEHSNLKFDKCISCGKDIKNVDKITNECDNNYDKGCFMYNQI